MPINRSIQDLPRADRPEGNIPAKNNFVAEAIADAWYDAYIANGEDQLGHAIPEAGPYRGSFASKRCNRALAYGLERIQPSNPPTQADMWRMGLGSTVHEMLQRIVADLFPGSENEVKIDLRPIGVPGSSHADIVMDYNGRKTLVELKSINGFGFKMIATPFKGAPEGARFGDVMQGALAAAALGCEQLVVAYLAMEVVSPQLAKDYSETEAGRFAAEWHYTVEELQPIITAEVKRITTLVDYVAEHGAKLVRRELVAPEYPEGAIVTDPARGMWIVRGEGQAIEDTGDTWMCAYCWHRDLCINDGDS